MKNSETLSTENKYEVETWALLAYYAARSDDSLPTFRYNLSGPEISVRIYHYTLRNSPEERSSHTLRGGSLKSQIWNWFLQFTPLLIS